MQQSISDFLHKSCGNLFAIAFDTVNPPADRAARKCLKENCPEEDKSQSYAEQYIDYLIYGNSDWFDDDDDF